MITPSNEPPQDSATDDPAQLPAPAESIATPDSSRSALPRPRETPALSRAAPKPPRRGSGLAWSVALLALAVSAYLGYRQWLTPTSANTTPVSASTVADAGLSQSQTQALQEQKRLIAANSQRMSAMEARIEDLQAVNGVLREQLLSYGQRQSLSEDVLADLARERAPQGPRMEVAEAEYLLQVGQTRLQLFGDLAGARLALQLADKILANSGDPLAGSVRGAISAELDALNAVPVIDRIALQARLDALSADVEDWPLLETVAQQDSLEDSLPWYRRIFVRLVDIRKVQTDDPLQPLGNTAARLSLRTHLALTRLLLLQGREAEAARSLLDASKAMALFDPADARVAAAQRGLAEIANLPLAAPVPTLGTALDELRRLRNLRGMAVPQPSATAPSTAPERSPSTQGDATDQGSGGS